MSKSPNLFLPAAGGAALVLGLAYGLASRDYGSQKIDMLTSRLAQVEAHEATATAKAMSEAGRAAELELKIAEVQAAAAEKAAVSTGISEPVPAMEGRYGLGRVALEEEIAAWDVDVLPDGRGLPEGSGDVFTGEEVFADKCASCHGDFAEGVGNWPVLAGGFDTLDDKDPVKTVGSYWPYLSTVWDYVHRSMPFGEAGTLSADETYAIVAYILYSNNLVEDEFELSRENFSAFEMYNRNGFVIDDRPEREYVEWRTEPCMENCKEEVKVTMRSVFLVETPEDGGTNSVMNNASLEGLPPFTADGPAFIPVLAPKPADAENTTPVTQVAASANGSSDLVGAGEKVFRKCKVCHSVGQGAKNKSGPQLNGLIGRTMGAVDGFSYSSVFNAAYDEGRVWSEESLVEFLAEPKTYMKGTRMAFSGLRNNQDLEAVIAYLKSFAE